MSNLYEITNALAMYEMQFDEETGEWLNEDELTNLEMERDEKIESLLLWAKNLNSEASAIESEANALEERAKSRRKKANNISDYVARMLNGEEFSTPKVEVKWRKSEAVIIPDDYAVPDKFVNLTLMRKPVKSEIKKYLKGIEGSDEVCDWARLDKRNNMSIK